MSNKTVTSNKIIAANQDIMQSDITVLYDHINSLSRELNELKNMVLESSKKNDQADNAAESNAESYDIVEAEDKIEAEDKVEAVDQSTSKAEDKVEAPLEVKEDISDLELHKIIDEDGAVDNVDDMAKEYSKELEELSRRFRVNNISQSKDGDVDDADDKQETAEKNTEQETTEKPVEPLKATEKPVDQEDTDRADNLAENTEDNLEDNLENKLVDHDETAEITPVKKQLNKKKTTKPIKKQSTKKTTKPVKKTTKPVKKTTAKTVAKKTSHLATEQSYGNIDQSEPYDYEKYLAERKSYGEGCECSSEDSDCDHDDVKANYDNFTMKCIKEDEVADLDIEYIMSKHRNFHLIEREKLKSRNDKLVTCILNMLDVLDEASGQHITTIEDFYKHSSETLETLNDFKDNKYAVFFIAYCLKEWFLACKNKYSSCNFTFQKETMCQYAIRSYRMGCKESLTIVIFYLTYKHKKIAATKYDERHMSWENDKICRFFGSMTNRELFDIMLYGPALSSRRFYDSMLLELVMKKQKTIEQMNGDDDE